MVRKTLPRSLSSLRPASLRATLGIALAATALAGLGCADEGLTTDYLYEGASGAAGDFYRPLRPSTGPGAAGTSGVDRSPGLNVGGAPGYSTPGAAGSAGIAGAGTFGRGSAGSTSSSDLDFGSAGTSGSSGF